MICEKTTAGLALKPERPGDTLKGIDDGFNLIRRMRRRNTGAQERFAVRRAGRNRQVDIYIGVQKLIPAGYGAVLIRHFHGDDRTGRGAQFQSQSIQSLMKLMRILPQDLAQLRPGLNLCDGGGYSGHG